MNLQQTANLLILLGALAVGEFTMLLVAVRLADMSVVDRSLRLHIDRWARAAPLIVLAAVILLVIGAVLKWLVAW